MKRSVLVLGLALIFVVFLSVVLVMENDLPGDSRASRPVGTPRAEVPIEMPEHPLAVRQAGEEAFRKGDYELAERYFVHYLELRPQNLDSYTMLAITCLMLDDVERAGQLAKKGLVRTGDEHPGPFYFILAVVAQRQGNPLEAEEYLLWSHAELGEEILQLLKSGWASPLHGSLAVDRLRRQKLVDPARLDAVSPPVAAQ